MPGLSSNTKRGIQGDGLFSVLEPEVFCRQFNGVIRAVSSDIDAKTFRLRVVFAHVVQIAFQYDSAKSCNAKGIGVFFSKHALICATKSFSSQASKNSSISIG